MNLRLYSLVALTADQISANPLLGFGQNSPLPSPGRVENGGSGSGVMHMEGSFLRKERWSNLQDMVLEWDDELEHDQKLQMEVPGGHEAARALLKNQMGLINQYGCWCYFEDEVGGGVGATQDQLDEICKTLHQGYECIIMDHDDLGDPCIPWEEEYNSAFSSGLAPFGLTMANLISECENQNSGVDSCARKVCKVEGWFVLSYFTYSVFGGTINSALQHGNGFDPDATCRNIKVQSATDPFAGQGTPVIPANQNGNGANSAASTPVDLGVTTRECCATYPVRFPYKHNNEKQCCDYSTYNPNLQYCCPDGSVEFSVMQCS